MKTTYTFWNTEESVHRYAHMEFDLYDIEKSYIVKAAVALRKKVSDIKILDLGCGGGRTTVPLQRMGFNVLGVDISPVLISSLVKNFPNIRAEVGDATKLDYPKASFDIILFSHNSIDYIPTQAQRYKALKDINKLLKKNGYFIFSSHIIKPIPYSWITFSNIIRNIPSLFQYYFKGHTYYNEIMNNGHSVKTFAGSPNYIAEELSKSGFDLVTSSELLIIHPSLFKTLKTSLGAWERYYIAQKRLI